MSRAFDIINERRRDIRVQSRSQHRMVPIATTTGINQRGT